MAVSYPTGEVFVTRAVVDPDSPAWAGSDSAIKGVFFHEIIHVKDGDVLEQWSYAEGQAEENRNKLLTVLGYLTYLLPFSYSNDY